MSNSALATYTKLSPSCNKPRNHGIDTITIHTMAGNMSAQSCAMMFADPARRVSSNYAIGSDGVIALIVEECNRSWCSSNTANDHRAVTIEVASLTNKEPFECSAAAMESLLALCADICRRNRITALRWRADKDLIGQADKQNMTVHRWFAAKSCPGEYLYGKMGEIAGEVNKRLGTPGIPEKPAPVKPAPTPTKPAVPVKPPPIGAGCKVMIIGERYATGGRIPDWARKVPHVVSRIDGARVLLGANGGINSWVPCDGVEAV